MYVHRIDPTESGLSQPVLAHDLRDGCRAVLHRQYKTALHQPITHLLTPGLIPTVTSFVEAAWKFWGPATHAKDRAALDLATRSLRSATAIWTEGVHTLPPADCRDPIVQAVQRASGSGAPTISALAQLCHPTIAEPLDECYRIHTRFLAAAAASGDDHHPADAMMQSVIAMLDVVTPELDDHLGGGKKGVALSQALSLSQPVRQQKRRSALIDTRRGAGATSLADGAQLAVTHPPFDKKLFLPFHRN